MSLPLILAAKLLKLKIYLFEPNLVLGRANKYFLNSCRNIFCYTEQIKNFPNKFKSKMVIIKPLVRENIYRINSNHDKKKKFTNLIISKSGNTIETIVNSNILIKNTDKNIFGKNYLYKKDYDI